MYRSRVHWIFTLALIAFVSTGLALAGGAHCTKSAEDCMASFKAKYETKGWLGVEMDKAETGMKTVAKVLPGSPAQMAGFETGDHIVSVNGVPYDEANHDKIKAMKKEGAMGIGSEVTYGVKRGAETVNIKATLIKIPAEVLTTMIEKHQKTEHKIAKK